MTGGYLPFKILANSAPLLDPRNGCVPVIISYSTTPNDHTSVLRLYGLFSHSSGER